MYNHKCRSRNCCDLSAYENLHRQLLEKCASVKNVEEELEFPEHGDDRIENSPFTREYLPKIVVNSSSEPNFPTIRRYDDWKEENFKKENCLLSYEKAGGGKNKFSKHKESSSSLLRELLDKKRCKANSRNSSRRDSISSNVSAATEIFSRNAYLNRYNIQKDLMEKKFVDEDKSSVTNQANAIGEFSGAPSQSSFQGEERRPVPGTYKFPADYEHPHRKRWTLEQLKATDGIIPCQMGTNQFASQKGMTGFGAFRNTTTPVVVNDAKMEPTSLTKQDNNFSDAIIPLQYGTNQFSSQRGMTGFGTFRDVTGRHVHTLIEAEFNNPDEFDVDCINKQ